MKGSTHNPDQYMADLRQVLAQGRKRIGFLFGAGVPAGIRVNSASGKIDPDGSPLIPAVEGLTQRVKDTLRPKYGSVIEGIDTLLKNPNIEQMLSHVRTLSEVLGPNSVHGIAGAAFAKMAEEICNCIGDIVKAQLPEGDNPFTQLIGWIGGTSRDHPIEIFTTDYDLLFEEAFERAQIPFFDGCVRCFF